MDNRDDTHHPEGSDAESRGGDHREIQDNGTGGASSNTMGAMHAVNYPLPKDVNAPHGSDGDNDATDVLELGVDESREAGNDATIADYGV